MLGQMLEAWGQPATRHAMIIHFPIVLTVVGVPLTLLAALLSRHRMPVLLTALGVYALLIVTTLLGRWSGEHAKDAISLGDTAQGILEEHESLGDRAWIFAVAAGVLLAMSLIDKRFVRPIASWLAVVAGLVAAGWVANTADHGGRLVYHYGAGTKTDLGDLVDPDGDGAGGDPRLAFFRANVEPVLVGHCLRCHNPVRMKRSGGLDLTSMASILEGGYSGEPTVIPGRPQESFMIAAVRHQEPDYEMPRGDDPLAPDQIAALERWIAEGAVWEPIKPPSKSN